MSNPIILPPLPEPAGTLVPPAMTAGSSWYSHGYTADQMHAYAAAVSAAKDAEIAGLRAELLKSLADNAPLRERVKVLEDALRGMVIANERHSFLRVGDALTAARAALEQKP